MNYQNSKSGETILMTLLDSANNCDVNLIKLLLSVENIDLKIKNNSRKSILNIIDKNESLKQGKEIKRILADYLSLKK